jgi:hypothetical protein
MINGSLLLQLLQPNLAFASDSGYVPRRPTYPTTATGSTGTRSGCDDKAATSLTILAPQTVVGQTSSTHPTFAWYVPEGETRPLEFNLYEQDNHTQLKLIQRVEMQSTSRLMTYTLPQTQPGLIVGRQYLWQVLLLCNPERPSSALVDEASVEVVPLPATVAASLQATRDRLQQAKQFAQAGLWYDALAAALEDRSNPYWLQLLNDLAQTEPQDQAEPQLSQRDRLQQIIAVESRSAQ